jgi:hypothetical protein
VQLIPESVARESRVFPLSESLDGLVIAAVAPIHPETIDKLRFILNRRLYIAPTTEEWITEQFEKHYKSEDDGPANSFDTD